MTVATVERVTIYEPIVEPEIFTLPHSEIDRILAEIAVRPKMPADPCLIEGASEEFSDEPITAYQDSLDASGYPYW